MRFPRGIRSEFRAYCINFSRNGKRERPRSRAGRGQRLEMGNRGAAGLTNKHFALSRPATPKPFSKRAAWASRIIETRSLPTLTRSYPRRFTFYVARSEEHTSELQS